MIRRPSSAFSILSARAHAAVSSTPIKVAPIHGRGRTLTLSGGALVLALAVPFGCGDSKVVPQSDAGHADAGSNDVLGATGGSGGDAGLGSGGNGGGHGGTSAGGSTGASGGATSNGGNAAIAGHGGNAGNGGGNGGRGGSAGGGGLATGGAGGSNRGGMGGTAGSQAGGGAGAGGTSACAQTTVPLGAASTFVVLAGSTVTNTGLTSVTGNLGVSPGTALTGFPPGVLVGTQNLGDSTSAAAEAALTTAYDDAAGRTLCPVAIAGNLGGQTLAPGLYKSTSSLEISSGDLTLDAKGDGNAVFIFQMASTLTTTTGRQVVLAGGAKSSHIFWQVGTSATLGATSVFLGTIMANQAITLNTGATINGRALARSAGVAMDTNAIVAPTP